RSPCPRMDPGADALDDVEALAGADVAEAARLLDERLAGARLRQPVLELALRVDVAPQRPRVEQADENDRGEADPAHDVARARRLAGAFGHAARFAAGAADPLENVDLDQVGRAGEVDVRAGRDHDAAALLGEARLAGGLERPLEEL